MRDLRLKKDLPNTKEWANTATMVLRELISNYNELVMEVGALKREVEDLKAGVIPSGGPPGA